MDGSLLLAEHGLITNGISLSINVHQGSVSPTCQLINHLKTKHRLLYLKTQFVPHSKHFSSRL